MKTSKSLWAAALAAACASAFGQTSRTPQTLDPVVVTASGLDQRLSDVIPSVTVISREMIDDSGAMSLADLIAGEPGVEIGRNGGLGTTTSFFLRGAESKNALILVDGVRMRDGITQSSLAENIPLGLIEQVEIVRGNVSAIYGDAAVGGVVNIRTRQGEGSPRLFVNSMIGDRETRDVVAGYQGQVDGLRFSATAQHTATRGFSATNPQQTGAAPLDYDRDGYENNALGLSLSKRLSAATEVGISALSSRSSLAYDNQWNSDYSARLSDPRQSVQNDLLSSFVRHRLGEAWQLEATVSKNTIALQNNAGTDNRTEVEELRLASRLALSPTQRVLFGLDTRRDQTSPASSGLTSRRFSSPFAGLLGEAGRWSYQLNIRHDGVADGDEKTTWLLGAGLRLSPAWRLTASTSTAFRLPTGYDLSTNSALHPEFHRSREVGLAYTSPGVQVKTSLFRSKTQNPIIYDDSFIAQNLSFQENLGLETTASLRLSPHSRLDLGLTLQNPQSPSQTSDGVYDPTSSSRVQSARRARAFGTAQWTQRWAASDWTVGLAGASRRRDLDSDSVGTYQLAGYAVINLRVKRAINDGLSLIARLDNALDKSYQLAYGYETPPRTVYLGLQYQPKR